MENEPDICGEKFSIGDDFGDNSTTFVCNIEDRNHELPHRDTFQWENMKGPNSFEWYGLDSTTVAKEVFHESVYEFSKKLDHSPECTCFDCDYGRWKDMYQFDNRYRRLWIFYLNTVDMNGKKWIAGFRFTLLGAKVSFSISIPSPFYKMWDNKIMGNGASQYMVGSRVLSYEELEEIYCCDMVGDCQYVVEGQDSCCNHSDEFDKSRWCGECQEDYYSVMADDLLDRMREAEF